MWWTCEQFCTAVGAGVITGITAAIMCLRLCGSVPSSRDIILFGEGAAGDVSLDMVHPRLVDADYLNPANYLNSGAVLGDSALTLILVPVVLRLSFHLHTDST